MLQRTNGTLTLAAAREYLKKGISRYAGHQRAEPSQFAANVSYQSDARMAKPIGALDKRPPGRHRFIQWGRRINAQLRVLTHRLG